MNKKERTLYIFDGKTETVKGVLFYNTDRLLPYEITRFQETEELNKSFSVEIEIKLQDDVETVVSDVREGDIVGYYDADNNFQAFRVFQMKDHREDYTLSKELYGEHIIFSELADNIVTDRRVIGGTAAEALTKALDGSRVQVGQVAELGTGTINFYYSSSLDNLRNVMDVYGGEYRFRASLNGNQLGALYVDLLARRGADTGRRFDYRFDLKGVDRTVVNDVKTALYGRGKSIEYEETGGNSRKITFADVVWSTALGDPVDKPAGQEWVGDPEALALYGYANGSRHRFGVVEFSDIDDPVLLLQKTWEYLQTVNKPLLSYEMNVMDFEQIAGYEHLKVRLGDTVFCTDHPLNIATESRIIALKRDYIEPENTEITLGNFIPLFTNINARIEQVEKRLNDGQGIWESPKPVDDDSIVNVAPPTPTNVRASGLFESINVTWDFDPSIKVAAYEVYGSKVAGFTPDASNLLYRGKSGGYTHTARPNETWYFRVRALNAAGQASAFSAEVSAATASIDGNYIADMTVGNAKIREVSADKITFGTLDGNKANIVNLNASNVTSGRLRAQYVEIGSSTVFQSGYDPSTKETPEGAQQKALTAENNAKSYADQRATQAENNAKAYAKPSISSILDAGFRNGKEFWSMQYAGEEVPSATVGTVVTSSESLYSGKVWQITGTAWIFSKYAIPVDVNRVYRVTFRVRQITDPTTQGTSKVYAGVATLDENFQPITGGAGTHRYCAAIGQNITTADGWQVFTGIISGEGDTHDKFRPGTKYVRPMFIVNHSGGNGTVEVDLLDFEDVTVTYDLEQRLTQTELKVTDDSIISVVTESVQFKSKADAAALENYATNGDLEQAKNELQAYADQKVSEIDLSSYATISYVEQRAGELDFKFSSSGGVNLLKNSVGYAGTDFWTVTLDKDANNVTVGTIETRRTPELQEYGAGSGFVLKGAKISQAFSTVANFYTVSAIVKKDAAASGYMRVYYDNKSQTINLPAGTAYTYEKISLTIAPTGNEVRLEFYGDRNGETVITSVMANVGQVALQWQHSNGEVYNTNVLMDLNGIRVISNVYNGYTAITPEEFAGYAEVPREDDPNVLEMRRVFTLNRDVTEMSRAKLEKEILMPPIRILKIDSTTYKGLAFVSDLE